MVAKQNLGATNAPDGSMYVTLTDGAGNLGSAAGSSTTAIDQTTPGTTNAVVATGNVASGSTDSGNPVKVGGKYNATMPTLTDGQRGDLQLDVNGNLRVLVEALVTGANDGVANANLTSFGSSAGQTTGQRLMAIAPYTFNGTSWDRARGDINGNYTQNIPSATVTAGIASIASTVATSSLVIKASAGNLYSVECTSGASAGYLMLFNSTATPADGTVTPIICKAVAANSTVDISWPYPIYCSSGISAGFSTTGPYTKTGSATAFISAQFK